MLKKIRKSSASVTLVLIGTAVAGGGLAGCSNDEMRRDVYASKQDCLADWGNTPADCEPAYGHSSGGSGMHYYGRPYYYTGSAADGVAHSSRAISSTTVSRGGFGGSAGRSGGG